MKVTRRKAGYQQYHVAKLLGDTVTALSLWENEWYMPNGTSLIKLCILYGKTLTDLYPEYYHLMQERLIEDTQDPDGEIAPNQ